MTVAEAVQTRREAELEHELGAARAQITTLANRVRDLEQSHITDHDAAVLRHRLKEATRQGNTVIGMTQRAGGDVHDPGRMALLLIDIRATLGVVS